MVKEIKKGRRYRVISGNSRYFNFGDIVVSLEDDCSVPYCVSKGMYKGNNLGDYSTGEFRAIADDKLEETEQEEQPNNTEKKITISMNDFTQALMVAMFNKGTVELISKLPELAKAFIIFGSLIEDNLFKEIKEGE